MLRSKTRTPAPAEQNTLSVIGGGMVVDGNLTVSNDVHIDGRVNGNVTARQVTVGAGATVTGQIMACDAIVHGAVEGNIVARAVSLKNGAIVEGDIAYETLDVEHGAEINGGLKKAAYKTVDAVEEAPRAAPAVETLTVETVEEPRRRGLFSLGGGRAEPEAAAAA